MFDRFTDNARKAKASSFGVAQELGHDSVRPEHLLWVLIDSSADFTSGRITLVAEVDSLGARLLARLGLNLEEARRRSLDALGITPEEAARLLSGEEASKGKGIRNLLRRLFRPKSR
jgi:hypothetical protein